MSEPLEAPTPPAHGEHTEVVRFGAFRFDLSTGELMKAGRPVPLQQQPARILRLLIARGGELVTRDELRRCLWADDTFVEFESALNIAVTKVRHALGDSATSPRFIETLPRRGYRFVADIHRVPSSASIPSRDSFAASPAATAGFGRFPSRRLWLTVALVAIGLTVTAWSVAFRGSNSDSMLRAVALTSYDGLEFSPTFSPDGSQIAFAWDGGSDGVPALYTKSLAADQPRKIIEHAVEIMSPAWSPAGDLIAYAVTSSDGHRDLRVVPPSGGVDRFVARLPSLGPAGYNALDGMTGGPLAWSPDGRFLAVAEFVDGGNAISLVDINSLEKRQLTFPKPGTAGDSQPSFDHAGHRLAFVRDAAPYRGKLFVLELDDRLNPKGPPTQLEIHADKPFTWVRSPVWTPDDAEIVFVTPDAMWRVDGKRGGLARPLRLGGGRQPIFSRDGQKFAFVAVETDYDIWELDLESGDADPLITSTAWDVTQRYSPDGSRIAWSSRRSGFLEIWLCRADGTGATQLTFLERESGTAVWSPDGKTIAFDTRNDASTDVFLISARGGQPRPFLSRAGQANATPSWSPDGEDLYFASNRGGAVRIWKIPRDGGAAELIADGGEARRAVYPFVTPDGEFVYYSSGWGGKLFRKHLPDGPETVLLDEVGYWTVGPSGVYFTLPAEKGTMLNDKSLIRLLDAGSRQVSVVFEPGTHVRNLAASPDGRKLLFSRQDGAGADVMFVEHLR